MIRKPFTWLIVLGVAGLAFGLDRWSKLWVLENMELYGEFAPIPALAPYFMFFRTTNTGVAFGLFRNGGAIFTVIAAFAVAAIFIYSFRLQKATWLTSLSLGLMLGGAAGNLVDRLIYGHVIDFLDFGIPNLFRWATFNLADAAVVTGVFLLALTFLLEERANARLVDA
ncbi:MAG: signal peptidase II [Chloroflexi bacterium]|nr:signal peptidase II [Chloroflexota bacterium]